MGRSVGRGRLNFELDNKKGKREEGGEILATSLQSIKTYMMLDELGSYSTIMSSRNSMIKNKTKIILKFNTKYYSTQKDYKAI